MSLNESHTKKSFSKSYYRLFTSTTSSPIINGDLYETIYALYENIFINKIPIISMRIISYYACLPITEFSIKYDNGIMIMYNDDNYIKISSLIPEAKILDMQMNANAIIPNKIPLTDKSIDTPIIKGNILPKNIPRQPRNHKFLEKSVIAKNAIEKNKKEKISSDIGIMTDEKLKYINDNYDFTQEEIKLKMKNKSKKDNLFNTFVSDKKIYPKIKSEVDVGKLREDTINPDYAIKYQLFKILEDRSAINFNNDDNIQNEFEIFTELHKSCTDDEIVENEKINVYVPHNYRYLSEEQKCAWAKKYDMTIDKFEELYVNIQEKSVFSKKKTMEKPFSDSSTETESESSSEDDIEVRRILGILR